MGTCRNFLRALERAWSRVYCFKVSRSQLFSFGLRMERQLEKWTVFQPDHAFSMAHAISLEIPPFAEISRHGYLDNRNLIMSHRGAI